MCDDTNFLWSNSYDAAINLLKELNEDSTNSSPVFSKLSFTGCVSTCMIATQIILVMHATNQHSA